MKLIVSSIVAGLLAVTAASLHATDQGAAQGQQQSPAAPAQGEQQRPATPAQPATQQPQRPATPAPQTSAAGQTVTFTGCIQSEAEYRRARDAGRGGAAGTGAGVGNEFILVNASMAGGAAGQGGAVGTSGSANQEFELTGSGEGQAAKFVNQRVEIMGMLKESSTPGGPTAGAPPRGVDVTSEDLRLREIEVSSVRAATGGAPCAPAAAPAR